MTLKEYILKHYPMSDDYIKYGEYESLDDVIFPDIRNYHYYIDDMNYPPFNYEGDNYYGGLIAKYITAYICDNYLDNDLNKRLTEYVNTVDSALQRKVARLIMRYKYKWHGLWESTMQDSNYDMLDNVNEIYDETITREPDLTYTDSNSTTYGQQTRSQSDVHGAQSESGSVIHGGQNVETTNTYGAQSETLTDNFGSKEITQNNEYGGHIDSDSSTETTYPFDSASNSYPTAGSNVTHSFGTREDELTTLENAHVDTHGRSTVQHIDTNETESASYTDTTSATKNSYTDTSQITDSQHVDSASGTKTESGTEETTITRRRHGNIGVTTSGQLIEDYRKTHNFDIVKIMANDIVNEIFDLNFIS